MNPSPRLPSPTKKSIERRARAGADVWPLLDVMFSLVLLFLLTSLLAVSSEYEALEKRINLPEVKQDLSANKEQDAARLVVTVDAEGGYSIAKAPISIEALQTRLTEERPAAVEIRGDSLAQYSYVMKALELAHAAGVKGISLTYLHGHSR